jgi:hypothetical protein
MFFVWSNMAIAYVLAFIIEMFAPSVSIIFSFLGAKPVRLGSSDQSSHPSSPPFSDNLFYSNICSHMSARRTALTVLIVRSCW